MGVVGESSWGGKIMKSLLFRNRRRPHHHARHEAQGGGPLWVTEGLGLRFSRNKQSLLHYVHRVTLNKHSSNKVWNIRG
jgi:hypothetical protein